jgi:hypothetical protein
MGVGKSARPCPRPDAKSWCDCGERLLPSQRESRQLQKFLAQLKKLTVISLQTSTAIPLHVFAYSALARFRIGMSGGAG